MKKMLLSVFMVSVLTAAMYIPVNELNKSAMILNKYSPFDAENGRYISPSPDVKFSTGVIVDSSGHAWGCLFGALHECISWNPEAGYVLIVNRGLDPTGIIIAHSSSDQFTSENIADTIFRGEFGISGSNPGGRYPTAVVSYDDYPRATFPVLTEGPAWGIPAGAYGSGGWGSGVWDDPLPLGGDIDCHKVIGKQLESGAIGIVMQITLGTDKGAVWFYRTLDDFTSTEVQTQLFPDLGDAVFLSGWDVRGDKIIVAAWDNNSHGYYYVTSEDEGETWSSPQPIEFYVPVIDTFHLFKEGQPAYVDLQVALFDDGSPAFIYSRYEYYDQTGRYPPFGAVYVYIPEVSDTAFLVNAEPDPGAIAPLVDPGCISLATSDKWIAAVWGQQEDIADSTAGEGIRWDIYVRYSWNRGVEWNDLSEANVTNTEEETECRPHVAKNLQIVDDSTAVAHIFFCEQLDGRDVYYTHLLNDELATIYDKYLPVILKVPTTVGIEEAVVSENITVFGGTGAIHITSKTAVDNARIVLYNTAGRKVFERTLNVTRGNNQIKVPGLSSGIYFYTLKTEKGTYSGKITLIR